LNYIQEISQSSIKSEPLIVVHKERVKEETTDQNKTLP